MGEKLARLVWNPELIRNVRAHLSRTKMLALAALAVIACVANIGINVAAQASFQYGKANITAQGIADAARIAFFVTLGVQLFIVVLYGANQSSLSIVGEREDRTWDIQRLSPSSELELAWGKLIGPGVAGWFIAACTMPVQFLAVSAGGVSIWVMLRATLILLTSGLLGGATGLAFSAAVEKRRSASSAVGVIVLVLFTTSGFLAVEEAWFVATLNPGASLAALVAESTDKQLPGASFFGVNVDFVLASAVVQAALTAALVLGVIRLIRDEEATFWSKRQCLIIFALLQALIVGGSFGAWSSGGFGGEVVLALLLASAVLALLLAAAATPGYAHSRSAVRRGPGEPTGLIETGLVERNFGERSSATATVVLMWLLASASAASLSSALGGRLMAGVILAAAVLLFALVAASEALAIASLALKKHGKLLAALAVVAAGAFPPGVALAAESERAAIILSPVYLAGRMLMGDRAPGGGNPFPDMGDAVGALILWAMIAAAATGLHYSQKKALGVLMARRRAA